MLTENLVIVKGKNKKELGYITGDITGFIVTLLVTLLSTLLVTEFGFGDITR